MLPLPNDVVKLIQKYKAKQDQFLMDHQLSNPHDLLFINLHDYKCADLERPLNQRSLNDMLKCICRRLKINGGNRRLSLYSFRHTICTKLANTPGMSYPWAADKMGHSLQMFMNTYVGLDPDISRKMTNLWVG